MMATNAKAARKSWEAKQNEPKPQPVVRKRRPRLDAATRRENALYRNARMVYNYDRDFDGEYS